jgi:hypothetical protein
LNSTLFARALGLARMTIGAGIWLAPRQAMAALGFDADNPQALALARLAGTRDVALGTLAVATAGDAERAPRVLALNAAVDAGDALAFAVPLARREGIDRAALGGVLTAAAATAIGLWLAARADSSTARRKRFGHVAEAGLG